MLSCTPGDERLEPDVPLGVVGVVGVGWRIFSVTDGLDSVGDGFLLVLDGLGLGDGEVNSCSVGEAWPNDEGPSPVSPETPENEVGNGATS